MLFIDTNRLFVFAFVRLCVAVMMWISVDEQFTVDMFVAEVWVTSDNLQRVLQESLLGP